ncbi:hypothetical protein CALCODRAFT_487661 [Calocera cornea HHB12733]|uniref:Small ribosomal subunit protein mS33 n=1 Tax=Calocera cornea HHB12733 TaxID=1353952 RepID=A0A165D000_9BASI|nr:hypothetical protein CALCODRAFT_487661 [Calocera cornea HHB12733]
MTALSQKLRQLTQLQSVLFERSYNPTSQHTGARFLRARLRGPSMLRYYPQAVPKRDLRALAWEMNWVDVAEEARLDDLAALKRRGKGAPRKIPSDRKKARAALKAAAAAEEAKKGGGAARK